MAAYEIVAAQPEVRTNFVTQSTCHVKVRAGPFVRSVARTPHKPRPRYTAAWTIDIVVIR